MGKLRFITTLATLLLCVAPVLSEQLSDKYNSQRPIVIACDWDKPPYEFLNDHGQPSGTNVDVMRAIMDQIGIPCTFVMKEWSNAVKTFERGDADLIFAHVNRFKGSNFHATQIINYNRIRVAMARDTSDIVSIKTLEKEGVVLKTGDYTGMYFKDIDSALLARIEYQSPKVALRSLLAGDSKFFVWGEEPLKWKIKELNLEGIYLNDVGIPVSEVHIIGRDKELIDLIDDQFSRLKQSGELKQILDKWMHPELVHDSTTPMAIYVTLAILLSAVLIILFARLAKSHVRSAVRNSSELSEMMFRALHMGNFRLMEYDIARDRFTNSYDGDLLPTTGMTLEEFTQRIHPNQRDEFSQKMQQLMQGRERQFELNKQWNASTDTEPQWLNFQGYAIAETDADGHPVYVVNAIHDVTHDIEENHAARQLVSKYERLSNLPFVGMSFYDHDGWLIGMNDTMKQLYGISSENPQSERFWETVCMFDIPHLRNIYTHDTREDLLVCQHIEYPELDVDRYAEFNVHPLFGAEGQIANYAVSSVDLTKEHDLDHEAHRQRRRLREVEQQTAIQRERLGFLLRHSDNYLMNNDVNERTITFFRTPEEPKYTFSHDSFVNMLHADQRETARQLLTDTTTVSHQLLARMTDGSQCPLGRMLRITFHPVSDSRGAIVAHQGLATDITTLCDARQQLADEQQLAANSVQLKNGFLASMTHELRTPLNAIVGFTGILEALDSDERAEYVRIIRNSSDMLQRLINDIIEASSITDGPTTIQPTRIDFATAFDDICLTLQQRVQNPEVEFIKDNPYDSFPVKLDIGRIQQVLTNFVTNAVKFTQKGFIRVGYRHEDDGLYLYCTDSGMGIDKEKQKIVFDRFVKLNEFVQGTGMGLAICKSIAERCGGHIGVHSEGLGKGCTFWMTVPCELGEMRI